MADGIDLKYGRVSVEHGGFHEGEPVFVLRAQDVAALATLDFYAWAAADRGADDVHTAVVDQVFKEFDRWQGEHATKVPDSAPQAPVIGDGEGESDGAEVRPTDEFLARVESAIERNSEALGLLSDDRSGGKS